MASDGMEGFTSDAAALRVLTSHSLQLTTALLKPLLDGSDARLNKPLG